ncbi:MAG: flippase [Chitinophagales bacterium]
MNETVRYNWLRSGSYNLLLNLQALIFGFGGFYLLVRLLDKHSFGIWTLFIATTTIFEMARGGLTLNATIKFLSQANDAERASIITASFFLSGIVVLCCIILNISIAWYLADIWRYPGLVKMFYLYSLVYLLQSFLTQFQCIEQSRLSFAGVLLSSLVKQAGFFIYILFCFLEKHQTSLINLIYAQGLSVLAGVVIEYFYVRKDLSFVIKLEWIWIRKLFNFGKYVFGTSISGVLSTTVNQMMLGALLSPDAAGAFNVSGKIINLIDVPTNALGPVIFPQSAKRFESQGNEAVKYLYEKSVGTILALLVPSLLLLFLLPGLVVHIIAGYQYPEAIPIVRVIVLCALINPFMRMFGPVLDSVGKPKINFLIVFIFTFINLPLNYVFIKIFGIIGAVYATLVADILIYAAMAVILKREFAINPLNAFIYATRFYPEFVVAYIKPKFKRRDQSRIEK